MPTPTDPEKRAEYIRKQSEISKARWQKYPSVRERFNQTGSTPHNKGKPVSEEERAKMSARSKGRKVSEETKAKIGAAAKGNTYRAGKTPHNKGKPLSEEQKAKLSEANKGKTHSAETKAKMSEAHKGKKLLPAHYKKSGEARRGRVVSEEAKEKQRQARKAKPWSRLGVPQSPETRKALSVISRKRWDDMTEEQKIAKAEVLQESAKDITRSTLEEVVALELDARGITYERQKRIGWYRVDFYIPEQNLIIEAQGCYWHGCEQCGEEIHKAMRERDAKRHEYLIRKGFNLKTIWEHERKAEMNRFRKKGGADGSG